MADWTNARPSGSEDLFEALYPVLWRTRSPTVCTTRLDLVAYFTITSACAFTGSQRTLAIVHMAAHQLEDSTPDSTHRRAGGPIESRSNERGSASYAVPSLGVYFGVPEHLLHGTDGGRSLLQMIASSSSTALSVF